MYEFDNQDTMELTKHLEKGLHHLGKAMSIAEDMCNASGEMGMRRGYRTGGGNSPVRGFREDDMEEYDDFGYPIAMGMRRGRGRGR